MDVPLTLGRVSLICGGFQVWDKSHERISCFLPTCWTLTNHLRAKSCCNKIHTVFGQISSWASKSVRNLCRLPLTKSCRCCWGIWVCPPESKDNSFFQKVQVFETHGASFFVWSSCMAWRERFLPKQYCWWVWRFWTLQNQIFVKKTRG